MPIAKATRLMKKMYGNMIRVRRIVKSNFSGDERKPRAMTLTMSGVNRTQSNATAARTIVRSHQADLANLKASSRPRLKRHSVKTGIKEIVNEPSAKRRRKRLGIVKAIKKASAASPAPKNQATTTSRMNPRIRLSRVAVPTIPAAFVMRVASDITISSRDHRLACST
jgi:hypothetical protein